MPTFVYKCTDCETKYEVFHKSKEIQEDIVCPSCSSVYFKKMMAAASIGGFSSSKSFNMPQMPQCPPGGCGSGMCGMN